MSTEAADSRPAYLRLADDLRRAIAAGDYKPGDQLPTMGELAKRAGIAVMTVREAIKMLTTEGLVISRQGKGVFVLRTPSAEEAPPAAADVLTTLHRLERAVDQIADRLAAVEERLDRADELPRRTAD
ncbi:GntR family transcriptional regulator [Actinosynnema mirum]|uniref:Transcriptional regulator, GntR family n=1 Tax=Actinosynnema mirum (strain ATCC 29888 / DSM 43827 / JCM 3225 / NBRC 14064 / NCIMB 13271 / NRRL B-12336 / IMRU 3971 / 101) TaxID=446462 RepID=C6WJ83_ACTMD|nr:GntR family transcriptional regulator [Actinosynnema mirum]ACU40159.1 transcriptional regulator, GntR family [Actinosynnema mirum DSM 43827]